MMAEFPPNFYQCQVAVAHARALLFSALCSVLESVDAVAWSSFIDFLRPLLYGVRRSVHEADTLCIFLCYVVCVVCTLRVRSFSLSRIDAPVLRMNVQSCLVMMGIVRCLFLDVPMGMSYVGTTDIFLNLECYIKKNCKVLTNNYLYLKRRSNKC